MECMHVNDKYILPTQPLTTGLAIGVYLLASYTVTRTSIYSFKFMCVMLICSQSLEESGNSDNAPQDLEQQGQKWDSDV